MSEAENFATRIEAFYAKHHELKEMMKNYRKEGKDMYIPELHLFSFEAKIHMAEITREQKDLDVIKQMLDKAEEEIKEASKENIVDVRTEVEEGAKKLIEDDLKKEFAQ